jgi:hypothetical protein
LIKAVKYLPDLHKIKQAGIEKVLIRKGNQGIQFTCFNRIPGGENDLPENDPVPSDLVSLNPYGVNAHKFSFFHLALKVLGTGCSTAEKKIENDYAAENLVCDPVGWQWPTG